MQVHAVFTLELRLYTEPWRRLKPCTEDCIEHVMCSGSLGVLLIQAMLANACSAANDDAAPRTEVRCRLRCGLRSRRGFLLGLRRANLKSRVEAPQIFLW